MAHYSPSRGWVSRPRRPIDTGPNPYDPASGHFAERHQQSETTLPDGLVRVDMGTPILRLPAEPAPVLRRLPEPPAPPPEPTTPEPSPADLRRPLLDPGEFKPGIGRG
ncbi:hypothetical protein NOVOSPHI9U_10170 [Novosphingobium sp. 9U]|nr:hypothetical protein NOVOSPHI9U_10170 [Novosphingobium sp. 9U]